MSVDLVYYNPDQTKPIDCTYEIPVDPEIIISNVAIDVHDIAGGDVPCYRRIESQVTEKPETRKKNGDSATTDRFDVMTEKQQYLTVKLGNLLP